jgi:nicotinate-nucleotide pyrophosphorylase (carboxylating)
LIKESGIIAGLEIFKLVYEILDIEIDIRFLKTEGQRVSDKDILGFISGNTRVILKGERVALNILQRMSGIATSVNEMKAKLNNRDIKIIDTRKTTPNFRIFEKLAVKIGGGENHRFGLYDMILIKDNHIEANGGIENTLKNLRKIKKRPELKVEVEVKNLFEFEKVLISGSSIVDIVMLDNFSIPDIRKAININRDRFNIEISGGINKKNISKYSNIKGIDYISIGSLTHSINALDISLDFVT